MKTLLKYTSLALMLLAFMACGQQKAENEMSEAQMHDGHSHAEEPMATPKVASVSFSADELGLSADQVSELLQSYLTLKDHLVASEADLARTAASDLLTKVQVSPAAAALTTLQNALVNMAANESSLDQQRTDFEPVSMAMIAVVRATSPGTPVYVQHCPMAFNDKGADWLSTEEDVLNPYFGDAMLRCGSVTETL